MLRRAGLPEAFCVALAIPQASAVIAFAAFSGAVAVDDVFQLHEDFAPSVLGIRQEVGETAYLALALLLAWSYRRFLIDAGWAWPAVTAAVLGAAVSADLVSDLTDANVHVLEDGLKFVGYLTWTGFVTTVAVSKTAGIVRLRAESQPARRLN